MDSVSVVGLTIFNFALIVLCYYLVNALRLSRRRVSELDNETKQLTQDKKDHLAQIALLTGVNEGNCALIDRLDRQIVALGGIIDVVKTKTLAYDVGLSTVSYMKDRLYASEDAVSVETCMQLEDRMRR